MAKSWQGSVRRRRAGHTPPHSLWQGRREVTVYAGDKPVGERTFTVDPSKKPKTLDSTPSEGPHKGKTFPAIYEFDGDAGKICQAAPGKDRPKEFDAKKGTGQMVAVYKRAKP